VFDWQAPRTLVALAWVAAGFLFDFGITFEWAEVQLLTKLSSWEPHKGALPVKSHSNGDSGGSWIRWRLRPSSLGTRLSIRVSSQNRSFLTRRPPTR